VRDFWSAVEYGGIPEKQLNTAVSQKQWNTVASQQTQNLKARTKGEMGSRNLTRKK